jgi:diguanylate cyclase (GGDEF)-like protein
VSHAVASPTAPTVPAPTAAEALRALTDAVQRLSLAESMADVQRVVRSAARRLTGADGATFVLRDDGQCFYADEEAIGPLWKGKRFPLQACVSGWAMLNRKPAIIADIYADERIPHDAYRPTFVRSLVMVPIRTMDPVGAIGIYWATRHAASDREVGLAHALADSTAVALQSVRVAERFDRAKQANALLAQEVRERRLVEADLREMSETDALTGLPNRRRWDRVLAEALSPAEQPVCVGLLDLDHFKRFNDLHGHPAGDDLLRRTAVTWRAQLRPGDVLARYGGEEFAVVLARCDESAARAITQRMRAAMPEGCTASIGFARWDGQETAASLVCRADEALYRAKQDGRDRVAFAA